jgi:VanZ family protein
MRSWTFWLPLLAWCGLIFYLSSRPNLDLQHVTPWFRYGPIVDYPLRKAAHVGEYAVLAVLARRGWKPLPAWLFCVFYAITDEVHQYFVPGRSARVLDVCLDSAAAALPYIAGLLRSPRE